jgi:flavin-dependent dehydrogenase
VTIALDTTIRIAGAGPSGLTAAIVLAHAGHRVDVFERRSVCGARFGGDLQGLENWSSPLDVLDELRSLGIPVEFDAAPFSQGIQTDGRKDDHLHFDRPAFYLVKRGNVPGSLDRALARAAVAADVRVHFGHSCPEGTADIVATGPRGRAPFAIDAGIVFETDAPDCAIALLNDSAAPGGYAYLLITNGYGCCCTMLFDDFPSIHARFAQVRTILLEQRGITVRNPRTVGGLGHVRAEGEWLNGRAPVVGEAAGLQDFLWGFGIRLAMQSGALAAQALMQSADYRTLAQVRFGPTLRFGTTNRWLWEQAGGGHYGLVRGILRTAGAGRILRTLHREQWWHRLLAPIARRSLASRYPAVFDAPSSKNAGSATAPVASVA